jgi:hypothetical protein
MMEEGNMSIQTLARLWSISQLSTPFFPQLSMVTNLTLSYTSEDFVLRITLTATWTWLSHTHGDNHLLQNVGTNILHTFCFKYPTRTWEKGNECGYISALCNRQSLSTKAEDNFIAFLLLISIYSFDLTSIQYQRLLWCLKHKRCIWSLQKDRQQFVF